VKSGGCYPRTSSSREASIRRGFKNSIRTPPSRSPARLVRHFFYKLNTPRILSCLRVGSVSNGFLAARMVRADPSLRRALEDGGQPGSSAMAWHSLAVDKPCESRVFLGNEARSYACRRVATGGAARSSGGGPHDRPPLENRYGGFSINVFVPNIFCAAATRSACSTNPIP
jgi:hypothetical protein